jgi:hypothetical protein
MSDLRNVSRRQGARLRGLVRTRRFIAACLRTKVAEKADPQILIQIQRAINDAREYSMRLQ